MSGPLITRDVYDVLRAAMSASVYSVSCSLDLNRSISMVEVKTDYWEWQGQRYPYPDVCKERTIYHWTGQNFEPVARFANSLIKLVPTAWGPPTFEIDGIKMLPTAQVSPFADAQNKVSYIQPRGKVILDTCGGLGYFAACSLVAGASKVLSYEKNPDVIWLRSLNPWSPQPGDVLQLTQGDVVQQIESLPEASVDAILHDPPRFGIAGELYSQAFYDQLARVLRRNGRLFHYTGSPNKLTSSRDVPHEVTKRLQKSGFDVQQIGDGLLAVLKTRRYA